MSNSFFTGENAGMRTLQQNKTKRTGVIA